MLYGPLSPPNAKGTWDDQPSLKHPYRGPFDDDHLWTVGSFGSDF